METPIRILHVVTHMNRGGLETMLMNYYRAMDREKVQFDFLVHRMDRADYDDEIESLGGIIWRLPRLVPWNLRYRNALNGFFREHPEYRIVHTHLNCLSSVILNAAKKAGVPVRIAHSHSADQQKDLKYPIRLYYRRQIPKTATELFACGKQAGDWLYRGLPYRIVSNAIDAAAYAYDSSVREKIRKEFGLSEKTLVVGHVGRFSPMKNHRFLIQVFASVHKNEQDSCLLLVGDGNLRQELEQQIRADGLTDAVILTGIRTDVNQLLQAMDVFVFPSLYEGLPVTLVEAQAAGLPCLVSSSVTDECRFTDAYEMENLTSSSEQWAGKALALSRCVRSNTTSAVQDAGFDINNSAHGLQEYYLNEWIQNGTTSAHSIHTNV